MPLKIDGMPIENQDVRRVLEEIVYQDDPRIEEITVGDAQQYLNVSRDGKIADEDDYNQIRERFRSRGHEPRFTAEAFMACGHYIERLRAVAPAAPEPQPERALIELWTPGFESEGRHRYPTFEIRFASDLSTISAEQLQDLRWRGLSRHVFRNTTSLEDTHLVNESPWRIHVADLGEAEGRVRLVVYNTYRPLAEPLRTVEVPRAEITDRGFDLSYSNANDGAEPSARLRTDLWQLVRGEGPLMPQR